MSYKQSAADIVNRLLEVEQNVPGPSPQGRRVRVRTPGGEVIPADWNGYYDMRPYGGKLGHSVALKTGASGNWSHGILPAGHEVLDEVPSYEQWDAEQKSRKPGPPVA